MSAQITVNHRDEALSWLQRAAAEPEVALQKAEIWLSPEIRDPEIRVLARHIACLALVERGQLDQAWQHASQGLAGARAAEFPQQEAQLRLTMAWIELEWGNSGTCWAHLDASSEHLAGTDAARATCLRGLLHYQSGDYREAIARLTEALPVLGAEANRHWVANALVARGAAHLYRHALDDAEADLLAAEDLFTQEGNASRAAACRHNRGYAALRGGDLPRALRLFSEARMCGLDTQSHPETRVDRAEALAAAGLNAQARTELERAAERLEVLGRAIRLAETQLALSGCALRDGDPHAAIEWAHAARGLFRSQRRPAWSALAVAAMWQGKLAAGHRSRAALMAARKAASACASYGWQAVAADLRLSAGRAALNAGMAGTARRLLALAAARRDDSVVTAHQRAVAWLAQALLAEHRGSRAGVFEACRNGLRVIEDHAAAMVAFELRVHAFGLAAELADLAVGTALAVGDPGLVLRWTERYRASALNRRTMRPPADAHLRDALVELRGAVAAMRDSAEPDPKAAIARVAGLERRVRDRALLVDGTTHELCSPREFERAGAELGDTVLISYFSHKGNLHACSIVDGEISLREVCPEAELFDEVARLQHILSRSAEASSRRTREGFADAARRCAESIEHSLLGPLLPALPPGRPLIVIPTGYLHAMAWAELPSCAGRSVTVAPSLRCWLRGASEVRNHSKGNHQVWIAGPGLEHAEQEVRTLHAASGGRILAGCAASVEQVLATVDGASTVHIAAHGWFRDDQPLLSCLDLADGPLFGYDFDRLDRAPATVVLSACEVGRSAVSRGDELSGLSAALLSRGTTTLIASVSPVPDKRTADVMMSLHANLRKGVPPAKALARAQAEHGESAFICLGYGG